MTIETRISRRVFVKLLVGTVGSSVTAACSTSSPGTGNAKPASGVEREANASPISTPSAPSADRLTGSPVPTPARSLKPVPRDRTFISVGVGGEAPGRFTDVDLQNPFVHGITRSGYQVVMEPLFYYNPYHTATTCGPADVPTCNRGEIPWLAVYYAYNADYTSAVINLREGVTWSDGTPFTAHDVVFTIEMLKSSAPDLTWSIDMRHWVASVVALDNHTVEFTLTAPNPRFIFDYFMFHEDFGIQIVPEHVFRGRNPKTFNNFDLARGWPVVTGPYRLVYADEHQKVWDRRDDWWGATTGFHPAPAVERLIFLPTYDERTMLEMIDKNQVDTTLNLQLHNVEQALHGNANVTTWTGRQSPYGYTDYWVTGLGFNDSRSPFDDPDIRWAINYAIHRDDLVTRAFGSAGQPAVIPFLDFPALKPYLDSVSDIVQRYRPGTYDPARSAQILQSKGYVKDRDGFWTLQGKRFEIPIVTFIVEQDITAALVDQLRKNGFDASYSMPADYITPIYDGTAAAYVFGHGGGVRDPYATLSLYHSRYSAPAGQRAAQPYRWHNPQYDRIVEQMAMIAPTDPRLERLFRDAIDIWLRELPDIALSQFYHRIPVNTTYWTGWPSVTDPYVNSANWHRTFELVILELRPSH